MRKKIDVLVWKYLVPRLHINMFRNKIIQIMAIMYLSCYSLPRRFFLHYLRGTGSPMIIDGSQLIGDNPHLLAMIRDHAKHKQKGTIRISQKAVSDPKWKYSVGSFILDFNRHDNGLEIFLSAKYSYREETSRLTRYLHNALTRSKKTKDFSITGKLFYIPYDDLEVPYSWNEINTAAPFAFYFLV